MKKIVSTKAPKSGSKNQRKSPMHPSRKKGYT